MQKAVELECRGLVLRGMAHIPDNGRDRHPFVIMYHGFTGSRMEAKCLFVNLSRKLEKAGIGSVRFDFSGSGESDGGFEDMTASGEIAEAKYIYEYIRGLEYVDSENVFLLGMSMGGLVAGIAAAELDNVKALVLWAPAGDMVDNIARDIMNNRDYIDAAGRTDLEGVLIGPGLMEDLKAMDVYGRSSAFRNDVLIIHGTEDATVLIGTSHKYLKAYGDNAELFEIEGADHLFQRIKWREKLYSATVNFIKNRAGL